MTERKRANRGDAPQLEALFSGYNWLSAWNSPEAFGRYVGGLDRGKAWCKAGWDNDGGPDWSGSKSMEEARHLSQGNWIQGRELIDRVTSAVKLLYPQRKEPIKYDIVGSVPSVARAVAGDVKNMIQPIQGRSKRRLTLTLISDMSANWTVDAKNFVARAAVLAALLDNIETMGYSCEVVALATSSSYHSGNDKSKAVCTCIIIKESHQPLDLARAAFGLGHPAMFRRMVFADWGGNSECEFLGHGLGYVHQMHITPEHAEKHIYFLPNLEGRVKSYFQDEETAVKHGLHLFVEALVIQKCPAFKKDADKFKYFEPNKNDAGIINKEQPWMVKRFKDATGTDPKAGRYDYYD